MIFKVVFHIDELCKWDRVMGNVNNMLNGLTEEASIVVIANGEATKGYLMPEKQAGFQALCDKGVVFNICQNSMRGLEIDTAEVPAMIQIVPAAVIELARRQHSGFAYIKP